MYHGFLQKRSLTLHWAEYREFTRENVRLYAPTEAGVYKLAYRGSDGKLYVFYVGQASNLDNRLRDHLSADEPNACIRGKVDALECSFSYARVSRAEDRDGAERALFLHYTPVCNDADHIPATPDIEVNPR